MRKRLIHKDFAVINVYASNETASKYMKLKLTKLKGEIDRSVAGVFLIIFLVAYYAEVLWFCFVLFKLV